MKSLPTKGQLEKYLSKLFPKSDAEDRMTRMVLLLPFSTVPEHVNGYNVITYYELGNAMRANVSEIDDELLKKIVEKYAAFIINLSLVLDSLSKPDLDATTVESYFDWKSPVIQNFIALRLTSIAWKLRMSVLVNELKSRLDDGTFKIYDSWDEYRKPTESTGILIGVSLSNNKPIVECFMMLDEETEYFIQLDHGVYNHGVTIKSEAGEAIKLKKSKKDKDVAKKELLENLTDGTLQSNLLKELGIDKEDFLSYNNMYYTHVEDKDKVISKMTLSEVLDKIAEEIKTTYKKYHKNNQ